MCGTTFSKERSIRTSPNKNSSQPVRDGPEQKRVIHFGNSVKLNAVSTLVTMVNRISRLNGEGPGDNVLSVGFGLPLVMVSVATVKPGDSVESDA